MKTRFLLWTIMAASIFMATIIYADTIKVNGEFICPPDKMPTDMAHSSTIIETSNGTLLVAWFGGKGEHDPSCQIWASRYTYGAWTEPAVIATNESTLGEVKPAWNPVLFNFKNGKIILFYKLGDRPYYWWGLYKVSQDNGYSWGETQDLPSGILGPIKNKPIQLNNGDLLCPSSYETHSRMWNVYFNTLTNPEEIGSRESVWTITGPCNESATPAPDTHIPEWGIQAIQPTILKYSENKLQALSRTKQKRISEIWSYDNGKTWTEMKLTDLLNPDSGIDAVTLKNGLQLLVYNKSENKNEYGESRTPLNVAISLDGKIWEDIVVLEDNPQGSYSYPSVIQGADNSVHITYSYETPELNGMKLIKYVKMTSPQFE